MKKTSDWGALRDALPAMSLGWDLALPIFLGALMGHLLHRRLGTGHGLTLALLLFGIATGFYNVARSVRRIEARERKRAAKDQASGAE